MLTEQEEEKLPAVTTAEAKAASTPNAQTALREISKVLLALDNRDDRAAKLAEWKKTAHPEALEFLRVTKLREKQHYYFMRRILPKVEGIPERENPHHCHDYSKDDVFFFAAPCFFDGGLTEPEMKQFMLDELNRHYVHEPHHPEYEKFHNGKQCSREDIREMAIDRLARNVQFGNGLVDIEVMGKFKPQFPLGNNEEKQGWFWEDVLKYKDFVQSEFHEMYPNTKEWAKK